MMLYREDPPDGGSSLMRFLKREATTMGLIWFLLVLVALGPGIWGLIMSLREYVRSEWGYRPLPDYIKSFDYWKYKVAWAVFGVFAVCIIAWAMTIAVESMWFNSVNYAPRFWTVFWTKMKLFWIGAAIFYSSSMLSVRFAGRLLLRAVYPHSFFIRSFLIRRMLPFGVPLYIAFTVNKEVRFWIRLAVMLISFGFGAWASGNWQTIMMYLNQVPTSVAEPIFNKTLGFYFFSLPFWKGFVMPWVAIGLLAQTVITMISYLALTWRYEKKERVTDELRHNMLDKGIAHVTSLVGSMMVIVCIAVYLSRYNILFKDGGRFFGAGYAEVAYGLPVITIYTIILSVLTFLVFLFGWSKRFNLKSVGEYFGRLGVAGWFAWILAVLLIFFGPLLVKPLGWSIVVKPDEKTVEQPYILHNIENTRTAFGLSLDDIVLTEMSISQDLTEEDLLANEATISNVRLWDWRMLKIWFGQSQGLRHYYTFNDVDIDRYVIDGQIRQIMLAGRELDVGRLLDQIGGNPWFNLHFEYTHGFGVVATAVNEFLIGGAPNLLIKDIPPKSIEDDLAVPNPRIYFGETGDLSDIFVLPPDSPSPTELDYVDEENVTIRNVYDGTAGIELGSRNIVHRFPLMTRYGIRAMLWAKNTASPEASVLMRRNISERVSLLAPFLSFDRDSYIVLSEDGSPIYYMWDAYTATKRYPYSQRLSKLTGLREFKGTSMGSPTYTYLFQGINYIRNSVKIVVDAYNGTVDFYVFDGEDPIIQTLMVIFPGMFKSWREMPENLYRHIRYPEDIFVIQSHVYAAYHMEDPQIFYNMEDLWDITKEELHEGEVVEMTPYFVVIQLPGEEEAGPEFVLMNSFTPHTIKGSGDDSGRERINMIAWMAARCDPPNYGQLRVYKFCRGELVVGTKQVESMIEQKTMMSEKMTLWGQKEGGSTVFKGNTLAIPMRRVNGLYTIIYVEPIFLQAENSPRPTIGKIVFGSQLGVAWGDTFQQAVHELLREYHGAAIYLEEVPSTPPEEPEVMLAPTVVTLQELVKEADRQFQLYKDLWAEGKYEEAAAAYRRYRDLWLQITEHVLQESL